MRGAGFRTKKYAAKLDGNIAKKRTDDFRGEQIKQHGAGSFSMEHAERVAKQTAMQMGAKLLEIPSYINFGRELIAIGKKHSGEIAMHEAEVVANKWDERGLDMDTLIEIARKLLLHGLSVEPEADYEASLSPLTDGPNNWTDRMQFVDANFDAGTIVLADNTVIDGAMGTNNFTYVLVTITGGPNAGQKWTLVFGRGAFLNITDVQAWLDWYGGAGVGNWTIDADHFAVMGDYVAMGAGNDYQWWNWGGYNIAGGFTAPAYLRTV